MTQPLRVVPQAAVSMRRPVNMMTASWMRPQRRPILDDVSIVIDRGGADSPVTNGTDENLTNNDTADLEILNRVNPGFIASGEGFPARFPDTLEKRGQVSNGEENVTLEGQPMAMSSAKGRKLTPQDPIQLREERHS